MKYFLENGISLQTIAQIVQGIFDNPKELDKKEVVQEMYLNKLVFGMLRKIYL
tara:strand:- start:1267 stop:1425 length:159 start_codon:yes stop_codon:yes gene_type:complete